jgi:hypothetical protein
VGGGFASRGGGAGARGCSAFRGAGGLTRRVRSAFRGEGGAGGFTGASGAFAAGARRVLAGGGFAGAG